MVTLKLWSRWMTTEQLEPVVHTRLTDMGFTKSPQQVGAKLTYEIRWSDALSAAEKSRLLRMIQNVGAKYTLDEDK